MKTYQISQKGSLYIEYNDSKDKALRIISGYNSTLLNKKEHFKIKEVDKYFYTVNETGSRSWEDIKQHELINITWEQAIMIIKEISKLMKKTIRLSETKGYNNQGHYFTEHKY